MPSAADTREDDAAAAVLVRARDRDRYWSALFASDAARPALLALYAYHAELDHVLASAREPLAGQIRLKWWRDAVESASAGEKTGNPIADALNAAAAAHDLPRERLVAMADARIPPLFGDSPADMTEFAALLDDSHGTLFELAAAVLGDRSDAAKAAAREAGLALGIADAMRALPLSIARGRLTLPLAHLDARHVDLEAVGRGETSPALRAALGDLSADAASALQRFRLIQGQIEPKTLPAFLPLAPVDAYLGAMAAPDFDPLRETVSLNPLSRFWRIWRAARRNRI